MGSIGPHKVLLVFSLKHAGILLPFEDIDPPFEDIDPKLEYGQCAIFLLYHDKSIELM